ncbi:MAG: sulfite exporter TauE/SafE family protein [Dehalococcoidales bacterium]
MLTIALFFIVAFIAASVASLTGFGSATMLIPFASLVIELKQAIILVAFFHWFSNTFKLIRLWRSTNWRVFFLYGVPSIITAYGGAMLLGRVDVDIIVLAFAAFIILFSIYSLVSPAWSLPSKNGLLVFGGALSGFTAGLIGLGGAIRGMFLISTRIEKEAYIATSAAIAFVTDVTRLSVYVVNGSLDSEYYWYILPLVVVAYIGTRLGVRLLRRLPETAVKRAVLVMLLLVGIRLILGYFGIF